MTTPETSKKQPRPPIVVVMGHVDHGKTTLLDYIRETKTAEREAGGITQSVGAYEVEKNAKKITFIDTPGHEAFNHMRQRGASIADIAVLVVAADDGVKPQTKEAISILKETETPFVVAINKIDKNNADPERTKQDLLVHEVYLEKMGGDVSWVEISAKTGEGIENLLEHILLMWEIDPPLADMTIPGEGIVLESSRDNRRGIVATVVVHDGVIKKGDIIATDRVEGKVRIMEDFTGKQIDTCVPSQPAVIVGFSEIPYAGEQVVVGGVPQQNNKKKEIEALEDTDKEVIAIIAKADVSGSLQALVQILNAMNTDEVMIKIVSEEVGDITDGDVKHAVSTGAYIIGFNVKVNKAAENVSQAQAVTIITSNIIYKIVEEFEKLRDKATQPTEQGSLEVLAVFSQKNEKQVIGGQIVSGYISEKDVFVCTRNGEIVGKGRIKNLQQDKVDCREVQEGECGLMVECKEPVQKGDILVVEG